MATKKKSEDNSDDQKAVKRTVTPKGLLTVLSAIVGYFKGSWEELQQVRWPNARSSWAMTFAVIVYSAFFVGLIILLDYIFDYLFKLILR